MPTSSWGPSTWELFHTLVSKIKEEEKDNSKFIKGLLFEIQNLCANLPCPYCSKHSMEYFKKNSKEMNNVNTKEKIIIFMFNFHNNVNKSLNKKEFINSNLVIYDNKNTAQVFNIFYSRWSASTSGMLNYVKRSKLGIFHSWLLSHKDKFDV